MNVFIQVYQLTKRKKKKARLLVSWACKYGSIFVGVLSARLEAVGITIPGGLLGFIQASCFNVPSKIMNI